MKNTRILLISIPTIIIISAIIGCAITYGSAPHAALARIFIDIGALIALVSIAYSLPKQAETIDTDDIVDGLRDLARNRFDRRLPVKEQDELFQVRQAFNELAGTLSDSRDPSLTHIRYNPMNRIELKVTPLPMPHHHSLHPELGQVRTAPELAAEISVPPEPAVITYPEPTANLSFLTEENASDHAIEEAPHNAHELQLHAEISEENLTTMEGWHVEAKAPTPEFEATPEPPAAYEAAALHEAIPEPQPELAPPAAPAPARPESYASDIGAADLFFLFERFKAAHDQGSENNIDFDSFLITVQKAREDLIRAHHCRDVKFEVVSDAGAVALRPRLIR